MSQVRLFEDDTILYRKIQSQSEPTYSKKSGPTRTLGERLVDDFQPTGARRREQIVTDCSLRAQVLGKVETKAKYLGVGLTKDFTWGSHDHTTTANRTRPACSLIETCDGVHHSPN